MYPTYYLNIGFFLRDIGIPESAVAVCTSITLWLIAVAVAVAVYFIITWPVRLIVQKIASKTKTAWDNYLLTDGVFRALALTILCWLLFKASPLCMIGMSPGLAVGLAKTLHSLAIAMVAWLLYVLTNTVYVATERQNVDLHGLIVLRNIVSIVAWAIAVLLIISVWTNRNVTYVISGLGAMAAVLTLVFRDTILGVAAGIKLSINKSLRKGDWIKVPKYNVDGEVTDVTITAIKVRNWDNSIASVPPYVLVEEGFQNYQEMKRQGGRRIKRSLNIDVNSVRYLEPAELERFAGEEWADEVKLDRPQVNITLFRRYLERKILDASGFRDDMLNMVRELQPGAEGIPVEIYLFTSNTAWKDYEQTQSDIFDEILASVHLFSLRLFQRPSGSDLRP